MSTCSKLTNKKEEEKNELKILNILFIWQKKFRLVPYARFRKIINAKMFSGLGLIQYYIGKTKYL